MAYDGGMGCATGSFGIIVIKFPLASTDSNHSSWGVFQRQSLSPQCLALDSSTSCASLPLHLRRRSL